MSAIPLGDARGAAPAPRVAPTRSASRSPRSCSRSSSRPRCSRRHPRVSALHVLPPGSNGIVVLDLSASISEDTYARIGATLSDLASSNGRYGLVVFSGTAYQALPPGTPAAELKPLVRYFTLPPQKTPGLHPHLSRRTRGRPRSAPARASRRGSSSRTRSPSTGWRARPSCSSRDLDDDPADVQRTALAVLAYRRDRVPLRIVGPELRRPRTSSSSRGCSASRATITAARLPQEASAVSGRGGFPWMLAALALAVAVALAVNELLLARLEWGERR